MKMHIAFNGRKHTRYAHASIFASDQYSIVHLFNAASNDGYARSTYLVDLNRFCADTRKFHTQKAAHLVWTSAGEPVNAVARHGQEKLLQFDSIVDRRVEPRK